jgi:Rrf2 family protein
MKLTRAASYALHAVTFMAAQKQNKPIASHHIAKTKVSDKKGKDGQIPPRFLLKVLKPLVTARILKSIKGPNGGYQLARPASEISLLEVIEAADQSPIRGEAPLGDNGPLNHKLETICNESADQMRKHLEKIRISQLVGGRK